MKFFSDLIDRLQLVLIAIITAFFAVFGFLLLPFGQKPALRIASKLWSTVLFWICGIKLKVYSPHDRSFYENNKFIYVSNHESNADIPSLFLAIPQSLFFIAKRELKKIPFLGWYMWLVGMIFINRSDRNKAKESMRKAGEVIKKGKSVISFPEGTRSRTGKTGVFKKGTFILSLQTGVPLLPIGISGARECMPAGTLEIHPGTIYLTVGNPIDPSKWNVEQHVEFSRYVRQKVLELKAHSEKQRLKQS